MQSLSFREYLKKGYYPFSVENGFELRMEQVISQLAPYKPSVENLAVEIGVSKNNVPDYLVYLEKAGMIDQLRDDTGGLRGLGKVEKGWKMRLYPPKNPTLQSDNILSRSEDVKSKGTNRKRPSRNHCKG